MKLLNVFFIRLHVNSDSDDDIADNRMNEMDLSGICEFH